MIKLNEYLNAAIKIMVITLLVYGSENGFSSLWLGY